MVDSPKSQAGCCQGSYLSKSDPEINKVIGDEYNRQINNIELIASENYVSPAVLETAGSVLTNKYAEGYPGKRYYGGCEHIDTAEEIAVARAKKIFNSEHVNVQPHAGSQANMGAYFALLKPGATILAMSLAHGGHLTHGSHVNFSGRLFNIVSYGVKRDDCTIDFDEVASKARESKPDLIVAGASAYPRIIDFAKFREIADEVGAKLMVDAAHIAGLIAGGVHPSPVPYCDIVTMTTHKTLRGPRGGMILSRKEHAQSVNSNIFPGIQGGPLMHIVAAKAVAFGEALKPEFKTYAERIVTNCKVLAEELKSLGFKLVSGGTDNHLILIDLTANGLTGDVVEDALGKADITVNKNGIPFDTQNFSITSGIRVGSPALTTRGMGEQEMRKVARMIHKVVDNIDNNTVIAEVLAESHELTGSFPMFSWK